MTIADFICQAAGGVSLFGRCWNSAEGAQVIEALFAGTILWAIGTAYKRRHHD